MPLSGLGRPKTISKFKSSFDYLNNYVFVIKDSIPRFQEIEREKEKQYNAARNKRMLQEQKLERAYEGLEQFRK